MRVLVNSSPREVPAACTLGALVPSRRGVAAAVNGDVIPGAAWDRFELGEGDAVEVLTAFQGG